MVDLLTIQTIGVILAAFSVVIGIANTVRMSFEEAKKRKIEFANNITDTRARKGINSAIQTKKT